MYEHSTTDRLCDDIQRRDETPCLAAGETMAGQTVDYNMLISGEGHILLGSGKQPEY